MHQTFYIDIDEEITSIVDRLRKSRTKEVIIVVPKRALLIQSIVNLKLLKKEADDMKKDVVIVTQDKLGKLLIEKTGIAVEQRLDDVEGEEIAEIDKKERDKPRGSEILSESLNDFAAKSGVGSIGSEEYYEESPAESSKKTRVIFSKKKEKAENQEKISEQEEVIINKELVSEARIDVKKKKVSGKSGALDMVRNIDIRQAGANYDENESGRNFVAAKHKPKKRIFKQEAIEEKGEDKINDFFQAEKMEKYRGGKKDEYKNINLSGNFWKLFLTFGSLAVLIALLAMAYLFLPKADVKIFVKAKEKVIDAEIKGDTGVSSVDIDGKAIPAKITEISDELSGTFKATGSKSAMSQKASGIITIYNEYSSSSQPLVATTRFLSESGKIFRLAKSVTVPGTAKVGEETKPGAIEAEVIADEPGEDYNIEPTTFTIPGFQGSGSEKYSKFYAKSFKAMAGGGNGTETVKSISAGDISNAKNQLVAELNKAIKQKIKSSAEKGEIVLDDAVSFNDATYAISNSEGEAVDSFTMTVKMKASAFVFKEENLKSVVYKIISQAGKENEKINSDSLFLEFGKSDADFAKNNIIIRVNAKGKIASDIDVDNLKKGILGKTEDDFKAYLKTYPDIGSAEVEYWPFFISGKIPDYGSRVSVSLDNI